MKRFTSFSSIKTAAKDLDDYMVELSRPLDRIMHDINCSDTCDTGSLSDDMTDDGSVLPPNELFHTTFPDEIFDIVDDASDGDSGELSTSSRLSGDCGADDIAPEPPSHAIPIPTQQQEAPPKKKLSLMEQFALSRRPMPPQPGHQYTTPLRSNNPPLTSPHQPGYEYSTPLRSQIPESKTVFSEQLPKKKFDPSLFGSRGSMGSMGSMGMSMGSRGSMGTLRSNSASASASKTPPRNNIGGQSMPNMKKMMSFDRSFENFQKVRLTPSSSKASLMSNSRSRLSSMASLSPQHVSNEEKQNAEFDFSSPAFAANDLRSSDNPMSKFTISVPNNFGQGRNLFGLHR